MSSLENGHVATISRRRLLKGGAVLGAIAAGPGVSILAPSIIRHTSLERVAATPRFTATPGLTDASWGEMY